MQSEFLSKKCASNPSGARVSFDPERHIYSLQDGRELVSATRFISKFIKPFETQKVAKKCVGKPKYKGMTAEEIIAEWQEKGDRARREGTNLHAFCEAMLLGKTGKAPGSDREARLFCQAARAVMEIEEKFEFIGAEMIIFSARLGVAGMIDTLVWSPRTKNVVIFDWKQNETIKMDNPWQKCWAPIGHLDDCDATRYGLQMSVYEAILREEGYFPEAKGFGRALVHVREDGYSVLKMPCLAKEVGAMVGKWQSKR